MKKALLLLLITASLAGYSQSVPGYLGKRLLLGYYGYGFPSFVNPNSRNIRFDPGQDGTAPDIGVSLNYQHHLILEYVLSKKISLLGDVSYTRTYLNPLSGSYIPQPEFYSFDEYPSISATGFALALRSYQQHFAPIGSYIEYKLGYTSLLVGDFEYESHGHERSVSGGETNGVVFGLGFGTRQIIADQWQIDFGLELAAFSKGWGNTNTFFFSNNGLEHRISVDPNSNQRDDSKEEAMLKQAEGRFLMHGLVNLKLGIGLLL